MAISPITVLDRRRLEIYGLDHTARPFTVPRFTGNEAWRRLTGYCQRWIGGGAGEGGDYVAFPDVALVSGKIYVVYAFGPSHGNSIGHKMKVYDPATDELSATVIFFLNDNDPNDQATYDTSLIAAAMANGDVVRFKNRLLVKAGGVVSVSYLAVQTHAGVEYQFWGQDKRHPVTGVTYRTGYGSNRNAIFRSANGQPPWTFVTDAFVGDGVNNAFTELAFAWRTDNTMLLVSRDNIGGSSAGRMHWKTAAGDASSLSAATMFTPERINGVQMELNQLPGRMLLTSADRSGFSGHVAGEVAYGADLTCVAAWTLPDGQAPDVANWSQRQQLETGWSTDGFDPRSVVLGDGTVCTFYYFRRAESLDPEIGMSRYNPAFF
jgi:hypothetical protein